MNIRTSDVPCGRPSGKLKTSNEGLKMGVNSLTGRIFTVSGAHTLPYAIFPDTCVTLKQKIIFIYCTVSRVHWWIRRKFRYMSIEISVLFKKKRVWNKYRVNKKNMKRFMEQSYTPLIHLCKCIINLKKNFLTSCKFCHRCLNTIEY